MKINERKLFSPHYWLHQKSVQVNLRTAFTYLWRALPISLALEFTFIPPWLSEPHLMTKLHTANSKKKKKKKTRQYTKARGPVRTWDHRRRWSQASTAWPSPQSRRTPPRHTRQRTAGRLRTAASSPSRKLQDHLRCPDCRRTGGAVLKSTLWETNPPPCHLCTHRLNHANVIRKKWDKEETVDEIGKKTLVIELYHGAVQVSNLAQSIGLLIGMTLLASREITTSYFLILSNVKAL